MGYTREMCAQLARSLADLMYAVTLAGGDTAASREFKAAVATLGKYNADRALAADSPQALHRDESDFEDALGRLVDQGMQPGIVVHSIEEAQAFIESMEGAEGKAANERHSRQLAATPDRASGGYSRANLSLIDRMWEHFTDTDELLREVRAENLDGSEPAIGELLERNTDFLVDVQKLRQANPAVSLRDLDRRSVRPLEWHEADNLAALADGWGLFMQDDGTQQIQAWSGSPKYNQILESHGDPDGWALARVAAKAGDGSLLHRKALLISIRPAPAAVA